jgi:hypothetical protein
MGVLVVNWDDVQFFAEAINLVDLSIATGTGDTCKYTDLYTGETKSASGAAIITSEIAPHSHAVYRVKCLPW